MNLVYIATPWAGDKLGNLFKASKLAALVNVAGKGEWSAVSPITMNNLIELDMKEMGEDFPENYWYEATEGLMRRCDAVIFGYGWEKSKGCRQEFEKAFEVGLLLSTKLSENPEYEDVENILRFFEFELEAKRGSE